MRGSTVYMYIHVYMFDILVVQLNFQFVDHQSGTGGCTYEVSCYFLLSRYDLLSFLLLSSTLRPQI